MDRRIYTQDLDNYINTISDSDEQKVELKRVIKENIEAGTVPSNFFGTKNRPIENKTAHRNIARCYKFLSDNQLDYDYISGVYVRHGGVNVDSKTAYTLAMKNGLVSSYREELFDSKMKIISLENQNLNADPYGAMVRIKRSGSGDFDITKYFTIDDATKAGLTKSDSWLKYKKDMLLARARVRAINTAIPDLYMRLKVSSAPEVDEPDTQEALENVKEEDIDEITKTGEELESVQDFSSPVETPSPQPSPNSNSQDVTKPAHEVANNKLAESCAEPVSENPLEVKYTIKFYRFVEKMMKDRGLIPETLVVKDEDLQIGGDVTLKAYIDKAMKLLTEYRKRQGGQS